MKMPYFKNYFSLNIPQAWNKILFKLYYKIIKSIFTISTSNDRELNKINAIINYIHNIINTRKLFGRNN